MTRTIQCKGGPDFCGAGYEESKDKRRLTGQLERVYKTMEDGKYRTLKELEKLTGDPQSSISAQMRHLRKPQFGSHTVEKRRRLGRSGAAGTWEYALSINSSAS